MKNRTKFILSIIIAILISILAFFGREVIKEKEERIKSLETKLTNISKENKELSLLLEEKSEEKDIEITEYYKDGNKKSEKKIKTKKDSNKQALSEKESKEDKITLYQKDLEKKTKEREVINPKRFTLGIGPVSRLNNIDFKDLKPQVEIEGRYKINNNLELQGRGSPFGDKYFDLSLKFILEF